MAVHALLCALFKDLSVFFYIVKLLPLNLIKKPIVFLGSSQQKTIINAMAVNEEGVLATGGVYLLYTFDLVMQNPNDIGAGHVAWESFALLDFLLYCPFYTSICSFVHGVNGISFYMR